MVTSDERMKILQMLHEGKINPDEAAQLLQALDVEVEEPVADRAAASRSAAYAAANRAADARGADPRAANPRVGFPEPDPVIEGRKAHWLRVRVTDTDTGKPRVNLRVPVSLVNLGVKLGSRFAPEIDGVDMSQLLQAVQMGEPGPFVDVFDEDDGEHVEVFLE